jgi:hypothetical protein
MELLHSSIQTLPDFWAPPYICAVPGSFCQWFVCLEKTWLAWYMFLQNFVNFFAMCKTATKCSLDDLAGYINLCMFMCQCFPAGSTGLRRSARLQKKLQSRLPSWGRKAYWCIDAVSMLCKLSTAIMLSTFANWNCNQSHFEQAGMVHQQWNGVAQRSRNVKDLLLSNWPFLNDQWSSYHLILVITFSLVSAASGGLILTECKNLFCN